MKAAILLLSLLALLPTATATAREATPTGYENLTVGERRALNHWRLTHFADTAGIADKWNPRTPLYTVADTPTRYAMTSDGTDTSRYLLTPAEGSGWYDTNGRQVAYDNRQAVEYRHAFKGRTSGTIITYTIRQGEQA